MAFHARACVPISERVRFTAKFSLDLWCNKTLVMQC